MARTLLAAVLCASFVAVAVTQTQKPTFEVASIRRNMSGAPLFRFSIDFHPARFVASNVFLRLVVAVAYAEEGRDPAIDRVIGGPAWIDSDAFDIEATTERTASSPATMKLMLRTLLEERFGLRLQNEQRSLPAYALLLNRSDGQLGPQLRPAQARNCSELTFEQRRDRRCGDGAYVDKPTMTRYV